MTNLFESKNATVSAHIQLLEIGAHESREGMLEALATSLLSELTTYQEKEALDVNKVQGTFVMHVPIQYMQENAKEKDLTVFNLLKEQLTKINSGETAAMILPALTDENGNRMFTLEYVGPQKI